MLRKWLGAAAGAIFALGGTGVQPVAVAAPADENQPSPAVSIHDSLAPVVDGVVRHNVDQAHSPQLQTQLNSGNTAEKTIRDISGRSVVLACLLTTYEMRAMPAMLSVMTIMARR